MRDYEPGDTLAVRLKDLCFLFKCVGVDPLRVRDLDDDAQVFISQHPELYHKATQEDIVIWVTQRMK